MILIIGAMPEEVSALEKRMTDLIHKTVNGNQVVEGILSKNKVLLALSGVGKVNAAITATSLITSYDIKALINIGSAGGLQEGQEVGDIVLATVCQYHDFDIGPETISDSRFIFESSKDLQMSLLQVLEKEKISHHHGLLVSGDQFITKDSAAFLNIQDKFKAAVAVDMESTAIAAVAHQFKLPFVIIRALSDVTHQLGNELDFESYLSLASEKSSKICELFIEKEFAD